jgi:integrase/recombinase XerC
VFNEEAFLTHLLKERRLSQHTLAAYTNDLAQFIQYCKNIHSLTSVSEVGHLHIRAWIMNMMEAGQNTRSINRRLSCLKTYFKYARQHGWMQHDPMQKVVAPKTAKRLPATVQEHEMRLLLSNVQYPEGYAGALHQIIVELLYATGMRRSELAQLKLADVDFSRSVLKVVGKGNKVRLAPVASYLSDMLRRFIEVRKETFPAAPDPQLLLSVKGVPLSPESIYAIVRKYLALVSGAAQLGPHTLRHSFATHLSDHGADLNAIRELLGHSNLAATQVYMHNSIEKLKKVYDQAHPKGDETE